MSWLRDKSALAERAVAESQDALIEAEKAREAAKRSADYLRKERAKNHFSEDVRRAWRGGDK